MHTREDDIAAIQQVLLGKTAAYSILVERHQAYVFTLAMRYVNNRELAEELAQDVFVKAYRFLADYKGNSKFSTWLYTIVHTTCLSHLRKKGTYTLLPGDEHIQTITENTPASEHPGALLEHKYKKQALDKCIAQLSAADAEVITLFYQAEQNVEEIAFITGITVSNIKVRLMRARQKLRAIIETQYPEEVAN